MSNLNPEITFRLLPESEWDLIASIFAQNNWRLPQPEVAFVVIGELNDEVVSVRVLQPILHAEPAWDREDVRGKFDPRTPAAILEELIDPDTPIAGVLIVAENQQAAAAAKGLGFMRIKGEIWGKDVSEMNRPRALAAVADMED
jgi:hypothetical protein